MDDSGQEGRRAVERGLAAIAAAVPPLRLACDGPTAAEGAPAAVKAAAGPGSRQGLWHQHVALQLVAKVCWTWGAGMLHAWSRTPFPPR